MTRIVVADHERVIVTHSERDDTIVVLRPPQVSPEVILGVARVVLPHVGYQHLARHLSGSDG